MSVMSSLANKIALVTGASRGAGKAIAYVLGEHGMIVYVTGRTTQANISERNVVSGTIDETADEVTRRGGQGVAVQCDHTNDSDVEKLFAQIEREHGKLDLLVNNIWGGYERYDEIKVDAPFWEQPLWSWDNMFGPGVRAHFTASRLAVPLMLPQKSGLILSTIAWDRNKYLGWPSYDTAKHAIARMMYAISIELRPHNITALALAPGFMRTEVVLSHFNATEENWKEFPDLAQTESPYYVGRAIAALAADPEVISKTGQTLRAGDLAVEYNFTDVDGRVVPPFELPNLTS